MGGDRMGKRCRSFNIQICDLKDGMLYSLPDGMKEDLDNGGVRLKNIPITDSPLALLFK
jgi:hypothetical protein